MEIKVKVCDVCQDVTRAATQYTVTSGGKRGTTDRCEAHSEALRDILGGPVPKATGNTRKRAASAAPKRRGKVVSLEEIEAMKQ